MKTPDNQLCNMVLGFVVAYGWDKLANTSADQVVNDVISLLQLDNPTSVPYQLAEMFRYSDAMPREIRSYQTISYARIKNDFWLIQLAYQWWLKHS